MRVTEFDIFRPLRNRRWLGWQSTQELADLGQCSDFTFAPVASDVLPVLPVLLQPVAAGSMKFLALAQLRLTALTVVVPVDARGR